MSPARDLLPKYSDTILSASLQTPWTEQPPTRVHQPGSLVHTEHDGAPCIASTTSRSVTDSAGRARKMPSVRASLRLDEPGGDQLALDSARERVGNVLGLGECPHRDGRAIGAGELEQYPNRVVRASRDLHCRPLGRLTATAAQYHICAHMNRKRFLKIPASGDKLVRDLVVLGLPLTEDLKSLGPKHALGRDITVIGRPSYLVVDLAIVESDPRASSVEFA